VAAASKSHRASDRRREREREVTEHPYFAGPEVARIVAAARARDDGRDQHERDQDASMYLFTAHTGLRRGELAEQRLSDAEGRWLRVREAYDKSGTVGPPKSGRVRWLPLDDIAAAVLEEQRGRALLAAQAAGEEDPLVWPSWNGRFAEHHQYPDTMGDRFTELTRDLGLYVKGHGLHKLRHTFGTYAIHCNAPQSAVRDWMGQTSRRPRATSIPCARRRPRTSGSDGPRCSVRGGLRPDRVVPVADQFHASGCCARRA
jgi:integrase